MKITGQIEQLFAQAVALDQSGGLKNSIYVIGREVYILNYDHTVLIRFRLRDSETPFTHPISFKANDYDSNEFFEEDGKIVFLSKQNGYEKKKICGKPEHSPEFMQELFRPYLQELPTTETITISNNVLGMVDDDLSHIEFSGKKGETMRMIQRNIYSGGITEITEQVGLFNQTLKRNFGPVGLRTNDFKAMFTFQDSLIFDFITDEDDNYVVIRSIDRKKRDMVAIIACCLYDELIQIKQLKS